MSMKIGLIGCGAIGTVLADFIDKQDDLELACIFDLDRRRESELLGKLEKKPRAARSLDDMDGCDLIIEAASKSAVTDYALDILDKSDLMVMSVGALVDERLLADIKSKAGENGRHVYVPSGAIAGLDGIKAASIDGIKKVTLTTRKLPASLEGAPYALKNNISLRSIRKPTVIFEGSAREAVEGFPQNVNVAAALALAGVGPEKTRVRIIADPFAERNIHEIDAEGEFGSMKLVTENVPSPGNPKTSYLAALSAIATLKKIKENVVIGT